MFRRKFRNIPHLAINTGQTAVKHYKKMPDIIMDNHSPIFGLFDQKYNWMYND